MWCNIRAWRSNGERWNDPVRTRKLAISVLKNQHSTWSSSPHHSKLLWCCGSVISAFFAPLTISKKKRSPFEMSHTQHVSSWLSWEFCTSIATCGSRSVSIHSILKYNFSLKRYTVIRLTCDRPNCVSWTRSVMPANRQLTMTARGTAMSRMKH